MSLTEYETTVVIRANIGGDAVEGTLDRVRDVIKGRQGKLLAITHWGKKKLAYEIEKQARGIYVHTHYLGRNDLVAELERNLRINDNVLRFLTIRLAEQVAADEREETAYERPEYDADDEAAENEGAGEQAGAEGSENGEVAERAAASQGEAQSDRGED